MVSKRRLLSRDRVLDGKIPPLSSSSCRRVLGVTWVARVTRIRRERDSRPERRRGRRGAPAGRRQRGPSEIDASLGSSLIYAFITVNNASPFTSGLSRSFSPACLPACLPDARLSRPVVHLAVIYREPFHRARKSSSFSSSSSSSSCSSSLSSTASSCESHRLPDVF